MNSVSNVLGCLQLNCQRSKPVFYELTVHITRTLPPLVLLQEPYTTTDGALLPVVGYRCLVGGNTPWAAILVREGWGSLLLQEYSDQEFVTAEILPPGMTPFYVTAGYCRGYGADSILQSVARLERVTRTFGRGRLLMALDANAKSRLWHSRSTDHRGEDLSNLIAAERLAVLNRAGFIPTFGDTRGRGDTIDVTLASQGLAPFVIDWRVENWSVSDHRPIHFNITMNTTLTPRNTYLDITSPRFCTRLANWDSFQSCLRVELVTNQPSPDPHVEAAALANAIISAATSSIPLLKVGGKGVPWWTSSLTDQRRLTRIARHEMTLDPSPFKISLFRRYRNKYVSLLRQSRFMYFETQTSAEAELNPFRLLRRLTKEASPDQGIASIVGPTGPCHTLEESVREIVRVLFPEDDPTQDTAAQADMRFVSQMPPPCINAPRFTVDEVDYSIEKQALRKAPGRDGVTTELVKKSWPLLRWRFLSLMNKMLDLGCFPDIWKAGDLRLLPKRKGLDPTSPKSYRPLSLLPVLGKIAERVILGRLESLVAGSEPFHLSQFGFRPGRSTTDCLLALSDSVQQSQARYVLGVSLDIQGAFDHAWWPLALYSLQIRQCPPNLYSVMQSYLSNRNITFYNSFQFSKSLSRGCPQGSILGPFLWTLIMDDLLKIQCQPETSLLAYADDTLLLVHGSSRVDLERKSNAALSVISAWGRRAKLVFAAHKTTAIMLKGKFDRGRPPRLFLADTRVKFQDSMVHLGVSISSGLKFSTHIDYIAERALKSFMRVQQATRRAWGYRYPALLKIYKSTFESIITYAAPVWRQALSIGQNVRKLRSAQRTALLVVTRAYRTAPGCALPVIAGVFPADLLVRLRGDIYDFNRAPSLVGGGLPAILASILNKWQSQWDSELHGRQAYAIWPDIRTRLDVKNFETDHHLTQLLTGHGAFNAGLFARGLVGSGDCTVCGQTDTPEHALFGCPDVQDLLQTFDISLRDAGLAGSGDWRHCVTDPITLLPCLRQHVQAVLTRREQANPFYH